MAALRYLSVCSGIEAASVAWKPLGWQAAAFAEIEAAPRAVLSHHWPEVPLHGDFTTIRADEYGPVRLLVGGTPCQSFSVAGLRGGLADDRGNLALEYLRLAQRLRPEWLVWENVPGVLSSNGGRDFGAILGGMVELGYGFAYRVLDAQYVRVDGHGRAVPQRRRRVFVVGYLGDWRRAAAVLFERASLLGDPAPRREAGTGTTVGALSGTGPGGGWRVGADEAAAGQLVAAPFAPATSASNPYGDHESREGLLVAHSLRGEGFDASEDGTGRGTPIVPVAFGGNDTRGPIQVATAINAHGGPHGRLDFESETFIAFQQGGSNIGTTGRVSNTLTKGNGNESGGVPCIAFDCKAGANTGFAIGDVPGALRGEGHGGGHAAIAYGIRSDATREGSAKTPCADAEGRIRLRDPGLGIYDGLAPTLDAGQPHTVAAPVAAIAETMYGVSHADASQTGPDQALRALREAVGQETYSEWGTGIVAALRAQEILRSGVHGESVRCTPDSWDLLGDDASSLTKACGAGSVRALWEAGCEGCPPQGWQPSERLARELGAHLSLLPHQRTSAARFLLGVWRTSEGLGLLREALSALQETWRPAQGPDQPAQVVSPLWQVRRLTPTECERLMGFHDGHTAIPWRGGIMPDGPRYKMLGNSMAVNVMRWIGRRIEAVEDGVSSEAAA